METASAPSLGQNTLGDPFGASKPEKQNFFPPRSYSQQQASFPEVSEVSIIIFNHPSFDHMTGVTVPSLASLDLLSGRTLCSN